LTGLMTQVRNVRADVPWSNWNGPGSSIFEVLGDNSTEALARLDAASMQNGVEAEGMFKVAGRRRPGRARAFEEPVYLARPLSP